VAILSDPFPRRPPDMKAIKYGMSRGEPTRTTEAIQRLKELSSAN